jgi:cytoskeletal protein RodZ
VGTFGEKLRRQREHRGLTLDAISTSTKISTRMLSAIEDERFDQLPGGVFNKGFVRAYARQVGLGEEETVNDYLYALAESQVQSQAILPNFRSSPAIPSAKLESAVANSARGAVDKKTPPERRSNTDRRSEIRRGDDRQSANGHELQHSDDRVRDVAKDVPVAEAEAVAVEGHRVEPQLEHSFEEVPSGSPSFLHLSDPPDESMDSETFVPEPTPPSNYSRPIHWERVAIPLVLVTLVLALWAFYRSNHQPHDSQSLAVATDPGAPATSPENSPATTSPATNSPAVSAPVVSSTPAASTNSQMNAAPQANAAPVSSPLRPSRSEPVSDVTKISLPHARITKPKPPATFTLTIRAAQTSWVAITADGQPVATETLIAPANTSVRAQHEITVKTKNAGGVSFLLNGKQLSAEGAPGEAHTYTFDASGLRSPAASSLNQTN